MMFTALSGESEQIKGLNLGADDYITKPFKTPILLTKVKNILDRKKKSIDVNPLTSLPGNLSIQENVEKRIAAKTHFSLLYVDLDNFKSFNDKYGFYNGDEDLGHISIYNGKLYHSDGMYSIAIKTE